MTKKYAIVVFLMAALFALPSAVIAQRTPVKSAAASGLSALPEPDRTLPGVLLYRVKLSADAGSVWIYVPEKKMQEKLPVVLTSAGGSYLFNGALLSDENKAEHLPFVNKGFIVVAYETPGDLGETDVDDASEKQVVGAATAFKNSRGGIVQSQAALRYAIDKFPLVDATKIFAVGHSSAATHALLVAANDSRIRGIVAFAPATDLEKRLSGIATVLNLKIPGYKNFIRSISPKANIAKIKCPVLIFQSKDDEVLPLAETQIFVTDLQEVNKNVTFVTAENGGHYNSMVREGIPRAIMWLYGLAF